MLELEMRKVQILGNTMKPRILNISLLGSSVKDRSGSGTPYIARQNDHIEDCDVFRVTPVTRL